MLEFMRNFMFRKWILLIVAFIVLLAITGCPAGFESPLGDKAKAKLDKALLGQWQEDETIMTIEQFNENEYLITFNGKAENVVLKAFSLQVGNLSFLNCQIIKDNEPGAWVIAQYEVTPEKLHFRLVEDSFLRENKLMEIDLASGPNSGPKLFEFLQVNTVNPEKLGELESLQCAGKPQEAPTELQGIWKVVYIEMEGERLEERVPGAMMIFDGNKLIVRKPQEKDDEALFKLDLSQSPKTIDLKTKDRMMLGIYQIEGDQLIMAMGRDVRPVNFDEKSEIKRILIKLIRQKKDR